MTVIQSPNKIDTQDPTIFLAGSVDMGKAERWQKRVIKEMADSPNITILNPRRDYWDDSQIQSKDSPRFREQIEWELGAMELADIIFMYFGPKTKSPISMLELGLHAKSGKLMVCCPEGFWRKGNIDIVCERNGIEVSPDLKTAIERLKKMVSQPGLQKVTE